ncbi:zinc finger, CCHC-type containing protein [Tanacetum coccineum]
MSTEVHQAAETVTTSNELDLLFGPLFDEYLNGENQVVLKSSAVTTADASDKRQQQPDSTSSTSTLATSVTADGKNLTWNNVVPFQSDTIRLVQNGCSFYGLRSKDPNQHLKDFLKLVDSLDLRDQASNWLEHLPAGSITTWEDLTTHFLAQFFPSGRTTKLRNDILMFQQHQGDSLSEAWACFKDLLQKVPHHGIDLWL